jgi:hypothetical protein
MVYPLLGDISLGIWSPVLHIVRYGAMLGFEVKDTFAEMLVVILMGLEVKKK